MDIVQWKGLLHKEGVSGGCFKCNRRTMSYDSYVEYLNALPATGYVSFTFPNLQFGEVMLCGDCAGKVVAKEIYQMAKEKDEWLRAEYLRQVKNSP